MKNIVQTERSTEIQNVHKVGRTAALNNLNRVLNLLILAQTTSWVLFSSKEGTATVKKATK